jgi:hypothetical protein
LAVVVLQYSCPSCSAAWATCWAQQQQQQQGVVQVLVLVLVLVHKACLYPLWCPLRAQVTPTAAAEAGTPASSNAQRPQPLLGLLPVAAVDWGPATRSVLPLLLLLLGS